MPFSFIRRSLEISARSLFRGSSHLVKESPEDRTVVGSRFQRASREGVSVIICLAGSMVLGRIDFEERDSVSLAGTKERPRSKKAEWLAEFRGSAKSKLIWSPLLLKL